MNVTDPMSWPHDDAVTEVNPMSFTTFSDDEYLQVVALPTLTLLRSFTALNVNLVAQIIISREIHSDLYGMSFNLYLRTI
jgi:hypothetical protein